MKKSIFFLLSLMAMVATQAQNAAPRKETDDEALRRAIEAVDRAKQKTESEEKPTTLPPTRPTPAPRAPQSSSSSQAAKPAAPSRQVATDATRPKKAEPAGESFFTKIVGEDEAEFQNKEGIIIFRKNVVVDRPDLKIWCHELQVFMNRDSGKPGQPVAAKNDSGDAFSSDNLKRAVAKAAPGGVVVILRKTDDGEMVANCREAVYDGATGNIVLKGKPEVLQNLQQYAFGKTDDATLTLFKNGNVGGKFGVEYFQEGTGREHRRRLLAPVPTKQKEEVEKIDVNVPPPAATLNAN